ncbi:hypothetical protein ABFU82_01535 [Nocardioides sp. WV_118_6]
MAFDVGQLADALGEEILRYLLALSEDQQIADASSPERLTVLNHLQGIHARALVDSQGDTSNAAFTMAAHLTSFRPELQSTLANFFRSSCGAPRHEPAAVEDPVLDAMQRLMIDTWPAFLVKIPQRDFQALSQSAMSGIFRHPAAIEACRAFVADPDLSKLFPNAPSLQHETSLGIASMGIYGTWFSNTGALGSRQLIQVISSTISDARFRVVATGRQLTVTALVNELNTSLAALRRLAAGEAVEVPAHVGLSGVILPDGLTIELAVGRLRAVSESDHEILNDLGRVTCVLSTSFALRFVQAEPIVLEDETAYIEAWRRTEPAARKAHREFQDRIDQARLALLLASDGETFLATHEVSRHVSDPAAQFGYSSWDGTRHTPQQQRVQPEQAVDAARWFTTVREVHPESLDIAVSRILRAATARWDGSDAFIDAIMAWENAFGSSSETTFKVTASIAKLLRPTQPTEREHLRKELAALYGKRSSLVHGSKELSPEDARRHSTRAIAIGLDVLRSLYTSRDDLLPLQSDKRSVHLLLEG